LKPNEHQVSQPHLKKEGSVTPLQNNTNTVIKKTYNLFPSQVVKPGDASFQQFFGKKPPKT